MNLPKFKRIGIISGGGLLPQIIINSALKQNTEPYVLGIEGSIDYTPECNHLIANIGKVGKAFKFFKDNEITNICFAGKINRPAISQVKVDATGLKFLGKVGLNKLSGGDNHLLTQILKLFESNGFNVISPEKFAPEILAKKGVLTKTKPSKQDLADIESGSIILGDLSKHDIGQSIIIANKYVIGIEAAEGTDELIKRINAYKKEKNYGVLVKRPKSNQDTRIDLPTIGVETVQHAIDSNLNGIAIAANKTIIIDKDKVLAEANGNKIFIVGI
ncbi:MAG: UDP-2,3-diacylglucosamine diphosphatase LpxI [Rickettsiales bacterium]